MAKWNSHPPSIKCRSWKNKKMMGEDKMMFAQNEGEDRKAKIIALFHFKTLKLIVLSFLWQMDPDRG